MCRINCLLLIVVARQQVEVVWRNILAAAAVVGHRPAQCEFKLWQNKSGDTYEYTWSPTVLETHTDTSK
jgi:hypothetical protein